MLSLAEASHFTFIPSIDIPQPTRNNLSIGIKARPYNESGFSALIFFGSFLYQDKKERICCSLQCFPLAMQRFSIALWEKYCVHRNTRRFSHGVTNV